MQLASSGLDGLVKVWSVRTGECDVTLDAHDDGIWALDVTEDGAALVTGGMDGAVHIWNDKTEQLAAEAAAKKDEKALLTQHVHDAVRRRKWAPAADAALGLDMPRKMRSVVTEIISTSGDADEELRSMLRSVSEKEGGKEKLGRLLSYCQDWNAAGGASNATIASYLLQAVFTLWSPAELCDEISADKRGLVEALVAHTERHHSRVAAMAAKLHFVDYTLTAMRGLHDEAELLRPEAEQTGAKRAMMDVERRKGNKDSRKRSKGNKAPIEVKT
jgi:U3 small nucleolar RNA-associated protein 13